MFPSPMETDQQLSTLPLNNKNKMQHPDVSFSDAKLTSNWAKNMQHAATRCFIHQCKLTSYWAKNMQHAATRCFIHQCKLTSNRPRQSAGGKNPDVSVNNGKRPATEHVKTQPHMFQSACKLPAQSTSAKAKEAQSAPRTPRPLFIFSRAASSGSRHSRSGRPC